MKNIILDLFHHFNTKCKNLNLSNIINDICKIIHINKLLQNNLSNRFILDLYFIKFFEQRIVFITFTIYILVKLSRLK